LTQTHVRTRTLLFRQALTATRWPPSTLRGTPAGRSGRRSPA